MLDRVWRRHLRNPLRRRIARLLHLRPDELLLLPEHPRGSAVTGRGVTGLEPPTRVEPTPPDAVGASRRAAVPPCR